MSTIFTKIINREIPGFFIHEDEVCVAILDKFPAVPGQALVIPKVEVDYVFDLPDDVYQHILGVAKRVAQALDEVFATKRTCLVIEGFEIPHVHLRLYPMTSSEEPLGAIMPQQAEASDETLTEQAEKIKAALNTKR